VGTVWARRGFVSPSGTLYTGPFASAEYARIAPGSAGVPIETGGGAGTAGAHWDEDENDHSELGRKLLYELMSGNIQQGDNRISPLTVAALKDLGYQVDMSAAEAYRTHD
jgi:hypothetical protein